MNKEKMKNKKEARRKDKAKKQMSKHRERKFFYDKLVIQLFI